MTRSLLASVKERKLTYYTVFQITITTAYLIRIKYPFSSFNYRLSDVNFANFNKIHSTVSEQQLFKNGTQKQKFPIWKSRISSSYTETSVTVCAQSGRRLHGHRCIVEHALSNCLVNDILVKAMPLLDEMLFQVVDVANPAIVDALLEHAPHLIVHKI